jgi:hypothetical protein
LWAPPGMMLYLPRFLFSSTFFPTYVVYASTRPPTPPPHHIHSTLVSTASPSSAAPSPTQSTSAAVLRSPPSAPKSRMRWSPHPPQMRAVPGVDAGLGSIGAPYWTPVWGGLELPAWAPAYEGAPGHLSSARLSHPLPPAVGPLCDRTAQNNSVLSPKPVHMAIKQ